MNQASDGNPNYYWFLDWYPFGSGAIHPLVRRGIDLFGPSEIEHWHPAASVISRDLAELGYAYRTDGLVIFYFRVTDSGGTGLQQKFRRCRALLPRLIKSRLGFPEPSANKHSDLFTPATFPHGMQMESLAPHSSFFPAGRAVRIPDLSDSRFLPEALDPKGTKKSEICQLVLEDDKVLAALQYYRNSPNSNYNDIRFTGELPALLRYRISYAETFSLVFPIEKAAKEAPARSYKLAVILSTIYFSFLIPWTYFVIHDPARNIGSHELLFSGIKVILLFAAISIFDLVRNLRPQGAVSRLTTHLVTLDKKGDGDFSRVHAHYYPHVATINGRLAVIWMTCYFITFFDWGLFELGYRGIPLPTTASDIIGLLNSGLMLLSANFCAISSYLYYLIEFKNYRRRLHDVIEEVIGILYLGNIYSAITARIFSNRQNRNGDTAIVESHNREVGPPRFDSAIQILEHKKDIDERVNVRVWRAMRTLDVAILIFIFGYALFPFLRQMSY